MTTLTTAATHTRQTARPWLLAGPLAGLLFFAVATAEAFLRPAFDLSRHAISMLSLGDRGWLMVATFVVSGALTILCAVGLRRTLRGTAGGTWGPVLVGVFGVGLIAAGIFPPPAGLGFPAGTPADALPVMSASATVHSVAFMVSFGSLIASCFVLARSLRALSARGLTIASVLVGVAIPTLIALGMTGVLFTGGAFYLATMLAWAWLAAVALQLMQPGREAFTVSSPAHPVTQK